MEKRLRVEVESANWLKICQPQIRLRFFPSIFPVAKLALCTLRTNGHSVQTYYK